MTRPLALVTGASQGIGAAIAIALLNAGTDTIMLSRQAGKLEKSTKDLAATAGTATCMEVDFADPGSIDRLISRVTAKYSRLDVLVNCAAAFDPSGWNDSSVGTLDRLYQTNVRAPYALTQALLPMLIEAAGDVVFVNSSIIDSDGGNAGQYAATKHALKGLADALRAEVNESGVRVLSVFPGRTATPMQREIHVSEGREYHPAELLQASDVASVVLACIALPDTAEVTELRIRPNSKLS